MMVHGLVPNVKHGGPVKLDLKQQFQEYLGTIQKESSKKTFVPSRTKTKKAKMNVDESFTASIERWDSQKAKGEGRKKDNYIKGRNIDYDTIIEKDDVPFETITVTGTRNLLTDRNVKLGLPESVIMNQQVIQWLLKKHAYISTEAVNAGLMLLDKRLNEESNMREPVTIYTVHNLSVILSGIHDFVNTGKFVTIIPRDFGISSYDSRQQAFSRGEGDTSTPGSHYTLVSNFRCKENEVNIYETFAPFRSPDSLLTSDGVKLLKILTKSNELTVNCVNVHPQEESECGAISVALAVQLCFFPADGYDIHYKMKNVRRELYQSFRDDNLHYFSCTKKVIKPDERLLFSMKI